MQDVRVFAVSGFSGMGKTSLVEKLVKHLLEKGHLVGVVKSSDEDVLAPLNTDTRKHQDVGANPVILLGPNTTTIRHRRRIKLHEAIGEGELDFLILEGFKTYDIPKFWCIGDKETIPSILPANTKAIVRWKKTNKADTSNQPPVITSDDIDLLLDIIEKEAILLNDCKL